MVQRRIGLLRLGVLRNLACAHLHADPSSNTAWGPSDEADLRAYFKGGMRELPYFIVSIVLHLYLLGLLVLVGRVVAGRGLRGAMVAVDVVLSARLYRRLPLTLMNRMPAALKL